MDQHTQHIDVHQLASTFRGKLPHKSPQQAPCCIFRVPSSLRTYNPKVYKPRLVSIGPLHRHDKNLQAMEEIKLWYLDCLLARAPTVETSLKCFIEAIRGNAEHCRECYADKVKFNTHELVEIMVLDGCFMIEFFRKNANIVPRHVDDPIFKMPWMRKDLVTDFLLLENQLPWFVLERLFDLTNAVVPNSNDTYSLSKLAIIFFGHNTLRTKGIEPNPRFKNKHLLDFQRNNLVSSFTDVEPQKGKWRLIPCVTELLQAGVHFKKGDHKEILNVQFKDGVMTIPPITIVDNAESFIRNLIAYEQCDYSCKDKIASYAVLWDNLINSSKDLDFLLKEEIITCYLSTEDLSKFFKRLYNDADITSFEHAKLSDDIYVYCQSRWPRWRVILLRDYFGNPWSICSFIAAIVILILTFLQTVSTIFYR